MNAVRLDPGKYAFHFALAPVISVLVVLFPWRFILGDRRPLFHISRLVDLSVAALFALVPIICCQIHDSYSIRATAVPYPTDFADSPLTSAQANAIKTALLAPPRNEDGETPAGSLEERTHALLVRLWTSPAGVPIDGKDARTFLIQVHKKLRHAPGDAEVRRAAYLYAASSVATALSTSGSPLGIGGHIGIVENVMGFWLALAALFAILMAAFSGVPPAKYATSMFRALALSMVSATLFAAWMPLRVISAGNIEFRPQNVGQAAGVALLFIALVACIIALMRIPKVLSYIASHPLVSILLGMGVLGGFSAMALFCATQVLSFWNDMPNSAVLGFLVAYLLLTFGIGAAILVFVRALRISASSLAAPPEKSPTSSKVGATEVRGDV